MTLALRLSLFTLVVLVASADLLWASPLAGCTYKRSAGTTETINNHLTHVYYDELHCTGYTDSELPFVREYENATMISLRGSFTDMQLSPLYKRVSYVKFDSTALTSARLDSCRDLRGLEYFKVSGKVNVLDLTTKTTFDRLDMLELHGNAISSIRGSFESLTGLKAVYLNNNQLKEFDFALIPAGLEYLWLWGNPIGRFVGFDSLASHRRLRELNVEGIDLAGVPLFASLPQSLNDLTVTLDSAPACDQLRSLNLSALAVVSEVSGYLDLQCAPTTLRSLRMSNWPAGTCDQLRGSSLEQLTLSFVNVESSYLRCLPESMTQLTLVYGHNDAFDLCARPPSDQLLGLRYLDLSGNELKRVDINCVPPNVERLYLDNNAIVEPQLGPLSALPSGAFVSLQNNPIDCTCAMLVDYARIVAPPSGLQCYLTCAAGSQLAGYPFLPNLEALVAFDNMFQRCFASTVSSTTPSSLTNPPITPSVAPPNIVPIRTDMMTTSTLRSTTASTESRKTTPISTVTASPPIKTEMITTSTLAATTTSTEVGTTDLKLEATTSPIVETEMMTTSTLAATTVSTEVEETDGKLEAATTARTSTDGINLPTTSSGSVRKQHMMLVAALAILSVFGASVITLF